MIYEEFANRYLKRSEKQAKHTDLIREQVASYQESGQAAAETARGQMPDR